MGDLDNGSNKGRAYMYQNEVLLLLNEAGFRSVTRPREKRGVDPAQRRVSDHGDILGLPWTIGVRNQRDLDLSSAMNEVEQEAANDGTALYASVQRRSGHDVEESYVTMPLSVFIAVLGMLHPELVSA